MLAVTGVFRLSVFLHAPLTALYMIYKGRLIVPLLRTCSQTVYGISGVSLRPQMGVLRAVAYTAFIWTLVCPIIAVLAQYLTVNSATFLVPNFNWFTIDQCIFGLIPMPTYVSACWFSVCHSINVFYEVAPQVLAMVLIFITATGFRQVVASLAVVNDLAPSERRTRFESTRCSYVRLQLLLHRINEIFSLLLLSGCLRDILTFIAFTATQLRTDNQGEEETREKYQQRLAEDQAFYAYIYLFTLIALVNTTLRTGISIYCSQKVYIDCQIKYKSKIGINDLKVLFRPSPFIKFYRRSQHKRLAIKNFCRIADTLRKILQKGNTTSCQQCFLV
jgi:hypothetical protein